MAWPNGDCFGGVVQGRPSKGNKLHVLESSDEHNGSILFPTDSICSRTVHFEDGEILHLSLPFEREWKEVDRCPFGYWRRIGASNPRNVGKKRATSMTDFFQGSSRSSIESSKKARCGI